MIELRYIRDDELLTQIKRSFARVHRNVWELGEYTTPLFKFEKLKKENYRLRYITNVLIKVTVLSTEEEVIITQHMSFREDEWNMYEVIEE